MPLDKPVTVKVSVEPDILGNCTAETCVALAKLTQVPDEQPLSRIVLVANLRS